MKNAKWWIFVVISLFVAVKLGIGVVRLWKTGGLVDEAKKEVSDLKKENSSLQEKLVYVNSPEFVEKEARDKLGYGREGEVILVLSDQNANLKSQISNPKTEVPNWKRWWDLYIRI
ncbi:MAG: Septum formation initiator [Candidatus Amesbacteria bacterium GW2011_GWA2_42_12]|uniref:Septum formation initiator n=1 Tax=Candidatus Amesbacteria bacterium GW2011_GWA2_42_12 TaxID=1618356 RepID=A0A0G1AFT4_9BACT|nr:MAG: Septum formation initiator [Candidatus Amesbacteria bacterium GW2011_GWA2_42_12]